MNTEKKLYKTEEVMQILGLKSKSGFCKKVKRHGIVPVKKGHYCFFTDEMAQDLKIDRQPGRHGRKHEEKRPRKRKAATRKKKCSRYCWCVSVWNNKLMGYVVVHCGMTKKQADEFVAENNAIKRPCWR